MLLELWQSIIYDFEVDFLAVTVVIITGPCSLPTDRSNLDLMLPKCKTISVEEVSTFRLCVGIV